VFLSFQHLTYAIRVFTAMFPVFRVINSWLHMRGIPPSLYRV